MSKELEVWILPEDMVLPFLAAFRTLEKSVNPVFTFPMKCSKCNKFSDGTGSQGPTFVKSKKKKRDFDVVIGIKCETEGCNMVIKFERPISPGDDDFPQRLKAYPKTSLSRGDSDKKEIAAYVKTIERYLEF